MTETLNIEYHTKRLIVKALNKHRTVYEAADALGITCRNLFRLIDQYGIVLIEMYCPKDRLTPEMRVKGKRRNQYST